MSAVQANVNEVLDKTEHSTISLSEEPPSLKPSGSRLLILVERKDDWADYLPSESLMLAQDYLEHSDDFPHRTQVTLRGTKWADLPRRRHFSQGSLRLRMSHRKRRLQR